MDINCDLGEGYGVYSAGDDAALLPYVTSVNIACGFHAGDPLIMEETVRLAIRHGVHIGAHPGYPDLHGFGRREMQMSAQEIYTMVLYQLGALQAFVTAQHGILHHVKPHGALYNQCAGNEVYALAVIRAVKDFNPGLILYCLAGSRMAQLAKQHGLTVYGEALPDRRYNADGTLVSRKLPHALVDSDEEVLAQAELLLTEQKIRTADGEKIALQADTLCLHGDGIHALSFAKKLAAFRTAWKSNE